MHGKMVVSYSIELHLRTKRVRHALHSTYTQGTDMCISARVHKKGCIIWTCVQKERMIRNFHITLEISQLLQRGVSSMAA